MSPLRTWAVLALPLTVVMVTFAVAFMFDLADRRLIDRTHRQYKSRHGGCRTPRPCSHRKASR